MDAVNLDTFYLVKLIFCNIFVTLMQIVSPIYCNCNSTSTQIAFQCARVNKHEPSPVPLPLAMPRSQTNSTPNTELVCILMSAISAPTEVPVADTKTCILIEVHAIIHELGKSHGCRTFGNYIEVFKDNVPLWRTHNMS